MKLDPSEMHMIAGVVLQMMGNKNGSGGFDFPYIELNTPISGNAITTLSTEESANFKAAYEKGLPVAVRWEAGGGVVFTGFATLFKADAAYFSQYTFSDMSMGAVLKIHPTDTSLTTWEAEQIMYSFTPADSAASEEVV